MSDNFQKDLYEMIGLLKGVKEQVDKIAQRQDKFHDRLISVEGFKLQVLAIAGFATAIMTYVWDVVKRKLGA